MTSSAHARISLSAIQHNLNLIRSIDPAARVMAVVKGNAYGHGIVEMANVLGSVDSLAVARMSEAQLLREAGIDKPLVLLGGIVASEDLALATSLDVSLCVQNQSQIEWLLAHSHGGFDVWLKVDTGMNRLGFDVAEVPNVIRQLRSCGAVKKLGLMTHFANADDPSDDMTHRQIAAFLTVIEGFDGDISIANSAGLFGFAEALDAFADYRAANKLWIRPGIALFGVSPLEGRTGSELGLRPAMSLESRLISVRQLRQGSRVGYGGEWRTPRDTVVGVVGIGYGDGYSRHMSTGTPVLVNGREAPVVGVVSMDLLTIDLGPDATDCEGDSVTLWGEGLPVERVAAICTTAAYQLITGVIHREPPVYDD